MRTGSLLSFFENGNCPSVCQAVGVEGHTSQRLSVRFVCDAVFFHVCVRGCVRSLFVQTEMSVQTENRKLLVTFLVFVNFKSIFCQF